MNQLPIEILEQIFDLFSDAPTYYLRHLGRNNLKKFALVCRKWARITMPILWKEVKTYDSVGRFYIRTPDSFSFYNFIKNPNNEMIGAYIRELKFVNSKLWPICIVKIMGKCSYLQEFSLRRYRHTGNKGDVNNLLNCIQKALPCLRKMDISWGRLGDYYFKDKVEDIQKIMNTRKNLIIIYGNDY
jgi:hypothetical protein